MFITIKREVIMNKNTKNALIYWVGWTFAVVLTAAALVKKDFWDILWLSAWHIVRAPVSEPELPDVYAHRNSITDQLNWAM